MATKLQLITELSERTANTVVKSPVNWTSFLKTAAWNYKYPFHDQLLIYAQRPEATACAPIELWNEKFGRWVNRGAKGIALIDDSGSRLSLRHVFDVSDTNSRHNRPVVLWALGDGYMEDVTETLENSFGDLKEKSSMPSVLISTAFNAVEDNYSDYLSDLIYSRENSFLEELDDLNVEVIFKDTLRNSVAYMLLIRCGYPADEIFSIEDFQGIVNFNTLDTLSRLGAATSDISEMILKEIGVTVKELQKTERKQERTFANGQDIRHNKSVNNRDERKDEHGTDIHDAERLPDTQSDTDGGRNAHRQIWDVAKNISEKPQEGNIRQPDVVGETEQSSVGNRPGGEGTDRENHGQTADRESGTGQSDRSDGLDGTHEQPAALGGGNNTGGANLQLSLFPTVEQQIEAIEQAEDKKTSAFSISQEEIDHVLCKGTGFQDGKFRVYLHYQEQHSTKETIDFLKHEYGIGGGTHVFTDGTSGNQWHDGKGISLSKSDSFITNPDLRLSWNQVAKRLGELIAADRYLNSKEKERLPIVQQEMEERHRQLAEEAYAREILNREPEPTEPEQLSPTDIANYSFHLGDTVYIGAEEYEVVSFDNHSVELRDTNCPIFTKQFPRETFEQMLRENPLNDHLIMQEKIPDQPEDQTRQEQAEEPIWRKTQDGEVTKVIIDLAPERSKQLLANFHITDDELGHGGQKTKYGWNVAAIRVLNKLEEENCLATPEEQEILSRYVGWGGMPQVFDEQNNQWAKEYAELKELLDADEYVSARASTLNAHFTSPTIIKAMYDCLANMGFQTGNILEPACGTGNFFGLVPDSMKNSKLYGVELDSITGRIAKQLYQQANIAVQGFEDTSLPDTFFDLAIGNVPFGSYGIADKKYDKYKFLIHDYFFAKTLDKVRPGGIIAFITSKGTMDKQNPEVRKYIAQRAEFLGAVRLPNNAFLTNAGTEVTTDILFLQKRDRVIDIEPDWVHLSTTEDGIPINRYFADNPDMVLGTMAYDDRMYGNAKETTCMPYENADLAELLREALENIHAEITEYEMDDISDDVDTSIPADPNVRNFSYAVVDNEIYYRENSRMNKVEVSVTAEGRIKGMIAIRDCVRDLIEYQTQDYSDEVIQEQQRKLNRLYDAFTTKYGLLNSRGNNMAFSDDSSYCLLCSLEILDENGELDRKADMFSKRTIRQRSVISHVDTATEALAISIAEKACVDIGFMQNLTELAEEQLVKDLEGVVFRNPEKLDSEGKPMFETAGAYLSGNVREKLKTAQQFAEMHSDLYSINVMALEKVQPKDLSASEIDVRLGATWLPLDVVKDFIFELLETPYMYRRYIDVFYSSYTANWNVKGKNDDRSGNIKAVMTYGTSRINAYKIIEETLNLKDVRIFDTVYEDGVEKRVLNKKETAIAQQKQEAIKEAFQSWIWKDPNRRERLTRIYNDRFNSIRPREYDGSHIRFTGMNPEISLRKHQVDAVAHILYGGNTLLAHCVGAGKTYEMTAAAMESKHLGLCQKSMFVVPNHLTEQWLRP